MLAVLRFACLVPLFYALLDEPGNVLTRTLLRALHLTIEKEAHHRPNNSLNEVSDLNGTPELPPAEEPPEAVELPKLFPTFPMTISLPEFLPSSPKRIPLLC
jgi:hypothetical protein